MSNGQDHDEEDSKDNALRRKVEEQTALKTLRLTREKDSPFSIAMSDGSEVTDKRPIKASDHSPGDEKEKSAPEKYVRLTIYQQARVNLMMETFAVGIRKDGNALEYYKTINGKEISLFVISAGEDGLNEAEAALKNAISDLQNLFTLKFGVTFNATRQPNFLELDALGEALSVSDPAHLTTSGSPVKICFVGNETSNLQAVALTVVPGKTVEIHVRFDATTGEEKDTHEVAKLFVEAFAQHTILKANGFKFPTHANSSHLLSLFRLGLTERTTFIRESRSEYNKIKDIDQWEINQHYGKQSDGTDAKIRLPNGRLVNNKAATQSEVQRFESSASI